MRFSFSAKAIGLLGAATLPCTVMTDSTFNLFAYGTNGQLSAASLYYENGYIMVSNLTSPSNKTSIYFTSDSDASSAWTVHANTTVSPKPQFTTGQVILPTATASDRVTVGNSSTNAANLLFYGQTVFVKLDGKLRNPFYADATDTAGIWHLVWSPENPDDGGLTPVVLRTMRPPSSGE